MAACSPQVNGAGLIMIMGRHPDRLALAEQCNVIAIDDVKEEPVERMLELTEWIGAARGCECVGLHAHDPKGHERRTTS